MKEQLGASANYRQYVIGLRLALIGFASALLGGWLVGGILQIKILATAMVLIGFGCVAVGLILGAIGWISLYREIHVSNSIEFVKTVARDLMRGVPRNQ